MSEEPVWVWIRAAESRLALIQNSVIGLLSYRIRETLTLTHPNFA